MYQNVTIIFLYVCCSGGKVMIKKVYYIL